MRISFALPLISIAVSLTTTLGHSSQSDFGDLVSRYADDYTERDLVEPYLDEFSSRDFVDDLDEYSSRDLAEDFDDFALRDVDDLSEFVSRDLAEDFDDFASRDVDDFDDFASRDLDEDLTDLSSREFFEDFEDLSARDVDDYLTDSQLRSIDDYLDEALILRSGKGKKPPPPALTPAQQGKLYGKPPVKANGKPKVKLTAAAQVERKNNARAKTEKTQQNKAKRRQDNIDKGRRVGKAPQPNMKKGDAQSAKAKTKQAAANDKRKTKKQEGRAKFAGTKAAYEKSKVHGLPKRGATYKGADGKITRGKDIRKAVFNSHHFKGAGGPDSHPKNFRNEKEGPKDNKRRPLNNVPGARKETKNRKGINLKEYPVSPKKTGYQPGDKVGTTRVVTQELNAGRKTNRRSSKFQGVLGHDSKRKNTDPGFNDHFQASRVKTKKKKYSDATLAGTFMAQ